MRSKRTGRTPTQSTPSRRHAGNVQRSRTLGCVRACVLRTRVLRSSRVVLLLFTILFDCITNENKLLLLFPPPVFFFFSFGYYSPNRLPTVGVRARARVCVRLILYTHNCVRTYNRRFEYRHTRVCVCVYCRTVRGNRLGLTTGVFFFF